LRNFFVGGRARISRAMQKLRHARKWLVGEVAYFQPKSLCLSLADEVQRRKPDEVAQERALIGVSARGPRSTLFLLLQTFSQPESCNSHERMVILKAI
jgi:hypothetical protein